ncbi:ABC transporter permease [Rhodococcus sp. BP-252]|uniref:ABC transporter permease n=1 Tax=unclassified Rhodococcus (in: high G+C Gram-positive bacteria) TaxID=192944 RepID=UPI0014308C8A|nr:MULTISPECIES: ABC transporter permease [unclassified Rhodococcus (in: high G+C Gram-positive bacteria)]MBY6410836.1 ABC transporter permease [Rhodococcus sp. BP-320]MBY6415339.1 ABC transporter permease [Rhodococcus sp. BP-321]MBY6419954.1 ABC transporter permease [Rhodococcus sp. BP-324]MBY6425392.1 ABC transporter permease [Rhodococcus sp. BP-323]MBY6430545.1 ABC transporter permease [Rhodococcus sp. BP-322]
MVKRLLAAVPVLILVTILSFSMIHLIPGDAAVVAAGENASAEQIAATRAQLGLDQNIVVQYFSWVGNLLTGDLGTSLLSSHRNIDAILEALPVTLSLAFVALSWSLVFGVVVGVFAGLRQGTWIDRTLTSLTTLGISMPSFWLGLLFVTFFSLQFRLFPATGYAPLSDGIAAWFSHLVLPALALGTVTAAEIARQSRAGVIDVLERDYIRTATAKGLPRWKVIVKHTSKNAAVPVVTVFGLQAAALIGGAVIIEQVFGMPGLGSVALKAILERDFPVIQAFVVVITLFVLVINLLVDISYAYFNPKARTS